MALEQLPTSWAVDLWESAKTAGPFGTMLLLVIVVVQYRDTQKKSAALLSLTVSGLKALAGVERALKSIQNGRRSSRRRRRALTRARP